MMDKDGNTCWQQAGLPPTTLDPCWPPLIRKIKRGKREKPIYRCCCNSGKPL